ncbi:MAG: exodeoxyribonuclease V subunit alpha [Actinobacteria bacterium]|nr:exodeoxyribonuclease V subunit alpha [Actinomycetota bacterium]
MGVLGPFVDAGVLSAAEVQLSAAFARLRPDEHDDVLLALAMAARGPRLGHVCIRLDDLLRPSQPDDGSTAVELPWPDPVSWAATLRASDLVAAAGDRPDGLLRPLVRDGERIYLHRYHRAELAIAEDLTRRAEADSTSDPAVEDVLDALFGHDDTTSPDLQRQAARTALRGGVSVIAGGPGTGKTRTVARLLAAAATIAARSGRSPRIALAAPTGKAAARMTEALHAAVLDAETDGMLDPTVADELRGTTAVTLHRLLGHRPGRGYRHGPHDPLPHDLVVVDETSMVSLPLLASLLAAVRSDATVVLVGDPAQLASIEAGTVMADVVGPSEGGTGPLAERVTVLTRSRRFAADSGIAALAEAIRRGDADVALSLLDDDLDDVAWVSSADAPDATALDAMALDAMALDATVVSAAVEVVRRARADDAEEALRAAGRLKVLTATRNGPWGLSQWSSRIEAGVSAALPEFGHDRGWAVGRPVIVTANDHVNQLANGDVGVVVDHHGTRAVAFHGATGIRVVPLARLDQLESWWAMTIHKSQGSEFDHAVVALARVGSPIMTRELLYTAVTRARSRVTVLGSEAAIRSAIERPILRASGLQGRLWS